MMIYALTAFAATTPEANAVADAMIDAANLAYGSQAIRPTAKSVRLQPISFYHTTQGLREALEDSGCTEDALQGFQGGKYDQDTGIVTGSTESGSISNGIIDTAGIFGDVVGGSFGETFSQYSSNGSYAADLGTGGYFVGRWVRVAGRRGVFVGLNGTCDGTIHPADAVEDWTGQDLSEWRFGAAISLIGTGAGALLGGDLTDPENNGNEAAGEFDASWNWESIFANNEPGFGGGEFAYNIFDNQVGGGNAKWCCANPTTANPLYVEVEFANPTSLTHFTLTSGNDTPTRDPLTFHIEGSNDGMVWESIYERNEPTSLWGGRNQVARFDLLSPAPAYTWYRYIVFETATNAHQINELELFGDAVLLP